MQFDSDMLSNQFQKRHVLTHCGLVRHAFLNRIIIGFGNVLLLIQHQANFKQMQTYHLSDSDE